MHFMSRFIFFCFLFLSAVAIMGCSSEQSNGQYRLLIVEGEENVSGTFAEFTGEEQPVAESEYITSLEKARGKYPGYEIEQAPAVFIFERQGGEKGELRLKTYEINEAVEFLQNRE